MDQPIEKTSDFVADSEVRFDLDQAILRGRYQDELSAHRAKRGWGQILKDTFLLEPAEDYTFNVKKDEQSYVLACEFTSACGRYAFWRLMNHQAPDIQYMIEIAHFPTIKPENSENGDNVDISQLPKGDFSFGNIQNRYTLENPSKLAQVIRSLIDRITKTF